MSGVSEVHRVAASGGDLGALCPRLAEEGHDLPRTGVGPLAGGMSSLVAAGPHVRGCRAGCHASPPGIGVCTLIGAIAVHTHLGAAFAGPVWLRIMAADHTVIRAAGLSGMTILSPLVAADVITRTAKCSATTSSPQP